MTLTNKGNRKIKVRFFITLVLIFIAVAGNVSAQQNDSIVPNVDSLPYYYDINFDRTIQADTGLFLFHRYNSQNTFGTFRLSNGHLTQPSRNIYFASDFSLGLNWIPHFYTDIPSLPAAFIHSYYPVTIANAVVGSKKEQIISVLHSQNVNKRLNIGFSFTAQRTSGYYKSQQANPVYFYFQTSYRSKKNRYHLFTGLSYSRISGQLNGGLITDTGQAYTNKNELDLSLREVFLQTHKHVIINTEVWQIHRLALNKKQFTGAYPYRLRDSISVGTHFAEVKTHYREYFKTYKGQLEQEPYYEFYYRSPETYDRLGVKTFSAEASLLNLQYLLTEYKGFYYKTSVRYNYLNLSFWDYSAPYTSMFASATAGFRNAKFNAGILADFGFNGFNQSNYRLNTMLSWMPSAKQKFSVNFNGLSCLPSVFYNQYYSNHYQWSTSTQNYQIWQIQAIHQWADVSKITLAYNLIQNYMYSGSNAEPVLYNSNLNLLQASLLFHGNVKWLHGTAELLFQQESDTAHILGLPGIFSRWCVYAEFNVFKKQLLLQTGAEFTWLGNYYSYAYSPALNTYYYQNKFESRNNALADFYVSIKIKQVKAFFKTEQLNTYFTGPVCLTPYQALPGLTLKLGITWLFKN